MFCTKCGKQIDYDSTVCAECVAKAQEEKNESTANESTFATLDLNSLGQTAQPTAQPAAQTTAAEGKRFTRMYGFGFGLASAIISFFVIIFSAIGLGLAASAYEVYDQGIWNEGGVWYTYDKAEMLGFKSAAVAFAVISLLLVIVAVVFSILAIVKFVRARRHGGPAPIPTLICGIAGAVEWFMSLIFVLLTFFMAGSIVL